MRTILTQAKFLAIEEPSTSVSLEIPSYGISNILIPATALVLHLSRIGARGRSGVSAKSMILEEIITLRVNGYGSI